MLRKKQLHELTPTELLLLQKHIKLGKEHLEHLLNQQEIDEIFELATIPFTAKEELEISKIEIAGQTTLVVNTILTATLGAWMGLSGFLQFSLGSKAAFLGVLSFSTLIGACIGFQGGLLRKNMSAQALDKRKLQDLEMAMIQEINKKLKEELHLKIKELITILHKLQISTNFDEIQKIEDVQALCLDWINQLHHNIELNYSQNKSFIDYAFSEFKEIKKNFQTKVKSEEEKDIHTQTFNQIVAKLSNSSIQPSVTFKPWLRSNFNNIIVGLIPTLFGGFSSLFVYLGGAPTIAKELGHDRLFAWLTQPQTKVIEFVLAVSITLYFAFSFLYLNRKAYKRDQELSKIHTYITREENKMNILQDKLLKIKEAFNIMQRIDLLHHFAKKSG